MLYDMVNPSRGVLTQRNLLKTDVNAVAGSMVDLGVYIVPAGIGVSIGYGSEEAQNTATGRIKIDLRKTGAAPGVVINGLIRIEVRNARGNPIDGQGIIFEARTEELRTDSIEVSNRVVLAKHEIIARPDRQYALQFRADVTGVVSSANSSILINTTNFDAEPSV